MKVDLMRQRDYPYNAPGIFQVHLKKSLPFWKSGQGVYVHRVRSAMCHYQDGNYSHTSLHLWCGMNGLIGEGHIGSTFLAVPGNQVVCATCEGRAIGSGQLGAPVIAGQPVKFSPRK